MKRFLARAYLLAGITVVVGFILSAVAMAICAVLFTFRDFVPSAVAGLLITAFLFCCMDLWHRCDSYLKSSNDDKDS